TPLDVAGLAAYPAAVRRRVLRGWLAGHGVGAPTDQQLRACDALVGRWRGQGAVRLAGGLEVARAGGRVHTVPARDGRAAPAPD
ncbi:TilS substrate-binding domain-containing protein, partial [Rhodococcus aerolatus]